MMAFHQGLVQDYLTEAQAPLAVIISLLAAIPDDGALEGLKATDLYYTLRMIEEKLNLASDML